MTEADSRAQILAAATAVFAEKGFGRASMNDIVRASGLSKGGVYWHFKSKDEIVETIFDEFFAAQIVLLEAVVNGEGSAAGKLRQLAALTGQEVRELADKFPSPMEFYALAARDEELIQILETYLGQYTAQMTAVVQQGIDGGEFRAVDAAATAVTLAALFEGMLLLWAVAPDQIDLGAQVETAVELLLAGLQEG